MALVCDSLNPGISGSNSAEGIDLRILCLLCFIEVEAYATSLSLVQRGATGRVILEPKQ